MGLPWEREDLFEGDVCEVKPRVGFLEVAVRTDNGTIHRRRICTSGQVMDSKRESISRGIKSICLDVYADWVSPTTPEPEPPAPPSRQEEPKGEDDWTTIES